MPLLPALVRHTVANKMTRGDHIVIASAFILLIFLYFTYWHGSWRGAQAAVMVNGAHWSNIELAYDQFIKVPGYLGNSTLEVHDGRIRFVASPCDTKQCIHQGWLSDGGEMAACLPNRVSVQILSGDPRFDSINF
jgi:hypothetical protein